MHDQPHADIRAKAVAELHHFAELVGGIDMQQRKRNGGRIKRLLRQAHHHGRIFPNGIEHHGPLKFRRDLTKNMDAFGFEEAEMG